MTDVVFRAAQTTDVDAVLAFWLVAAEDTHRPADDAAAVASLIARDPDALLLAWDGDQIVGSLIAGWDGWRFHLYRLAVHPEWRRQGLAQRLLAAAEERFRGFGARRVDAMVLEGNDEGGSFWTAAGYAPQGEWRRWVKGGLRPGTGLEGGAPVFRAIRSGTDADIDACVDIWLAALEHRDGTVQRREVAARARGKFDSRSIVRFGVAGETPAGFALTTDSSVIDGVTTALLELLAVAPEASGAGIGRGLVRDAVEHAREASCGRIELQVRVGNAVAIALYRSAGFKPVGEPFAHPLGGQPLVTYSRALTDAPNYRPALGGTPT